MKSNRDRSSGIDAQLIWLAAVLIVVAGYFFVFRSLEERIADEYAATQSIAAALRRNDAIVRERPTLERRKRDVNARLNGLTLNADRSTIVARFVREAAGLALAHNVRVTAIDAARATIGIARADELFDPIALDLTLVGQYRDLLGAMRDLSHTRTLARIDVASVERSAMRKANGTNAVQVRLHITAQRLRDAEPTGPATHGEQHDLPRSS
ncbi:MAG: hypothetical protein NVSMB5_06240 [Candidatus Velthaea sp.]